MSRSRIILRIKVTVELGKRPAAKPAQPARPATSSAVGGLVGFTPSPDPGVLPSVEY